MARIKAQKIPKKETSTEDILALFCYKFPQYTYSHARKLPFKRIVQMLKVAEKADARLMYTLLRAIAGPHTKKGSGLQSLASELKAIING